MAKILICLFILGLLISFSSILYAKCGTCKWLWHDVFKWHRPNNEYIYGVNDASLYSHCEYCGKKIFEDSQGNWFEV